MKSIKPQRLVILDPKNTILFEIPETETKKTDVTVVGAHGTWGNEYIDDYLGLVLPITAEII